jgi:hypothetical protein
LIPLRTRRKISDDDYSSDQHGKSSGREKEKEKKTTQSQEERAKAEEKGEVANAKEEERQQAEVTESLEQLLRMPSRQVTTL